VVEDYANGNNFVVQDATTLEGSKALYCNSVADNVIGKQGNLLMDGEQVVYVKTENRNGWNSVTTDDGNAQVRISQGLRQNGLQVTFTRDGYITFSSRTINNSSANQWAYRWRTFPPSSQKIIKRFFRSHNPEITSKGFLLQKKSAMKRIFVLLNSFFKIWLYLPQIN